MTNKLKYFIGNWKMFGDFKDFKIIKDVNSFLQKSKKLYKHNKIIMCGIYGITENNPNLIRKIILIQ